ncbi:MAG: substrate-binding domain-containing protein [Ruminococcus sp.]|nr:substrate-binding domain-containing protein [Ruminococcus sp.]
MKKTFLSRFIAVSAALTAGLALAGCGSSGSGSGDTTTTAGGDTNSSSASVGAIAVVSREGGSGTRGAFIELMGIEVKGEDGSKTDRNTDEALIANSTNVVMTQVAGNVGGIGYISLGSLDDTVKAVTVDGTEATVDNILAGTYKVSRPFNIAVKGDVSDAAKDFMNYILSAEGQAVVQEKNFIPVDSAAAAFSSNGAEGKVVVGGSSSVSPVMEKLAESYQAVNPNVKIEIQTTDSSSGMKAAMDGTVDIGMASRELKDEEKASLTPTVIAMDGIAVIVNKENPVNALTSEQIMKIYTGEITSWDAVQ